MTDVGLFVFGCVVFLIAALGAFLFVYTRFREAYVRENARDWAEEARPRAPRPAVVPARALDRAGR
jgi:hypothetical protein